MRFPTSFTQTKGNDSGIASRHDDRTGTCGTTSTHTTTAVEAAVEAAAASQKFCTIRPHVKTHKCTQGAFIQAFPYQAAKNDKSSDGEERRERIRSVGVCLEEEEEHLDVVGFVASTIPEIEMLLECAKLYHTLNPFGNILYGVPISRMKFRRIIQLQSQFKLLQDKLLDRNNNPSLKNEEPSQEKGNVDTCDNVQLHVLVDNLGQVQMLEEQIHSSTQQYNTQNNSENHKLTPWSVYLKVDTGYHRAGVTVDKVGVQVAMSIIESNCLALKGLYSHWYVLHF